MTRSDGCGLAVPIRSLGAIIERLRAAVAERGWELDDQHIYRDAVMATPG